MRISDWSSDVCSSDLHALRAIAVPRAHAIGRRRWLYHRYPRRNGYAPRRVRLGLLPLPPGNLGMPRRRARAEPGAPHAKHLLDLRQLRRSEEHTSELQSLMRISYAVFCLKKTTN